MKSAVVLFGLVVLAGCQTKQIEEMGYSEKKALAEQIVQRCYAQGVKPNSPEMNTCSMAEVQKEHYSRRNSAIRQQNAAAAMSAGMANASQGYYRAAANTSAMNRTVTCSRVPSPVGYSTVRCY
ncbi:hypothetical protein [Pseudochrobactrum lubricantis]|uniref:hypothetical protein n=1 Tax=Pseudochrobactrum lubricantis TaxID=558172 RepID=UPI0035DBA1F1